MNRFIASSLAAILPALAILTAPQALAAKPKVGSFTEFGTPNVQGGPLGIAVSGQKLYYTEQYANEIVESKLDGTKENEYAIPTADSNPVDLVVLNGAIWFVEASAGQIGVVSKKGVITEYPLSGGSSQPSGIAVGSDGNLWVVENVGNAIDKVTPAGVVTTYSLPTSAALPTSIVAGAKGELWFTETGASQLGKITTKGVITEYAVNAGSGPQGIAIGNDGNIWYTALYDGAIGVYNVKKATATEYTVPGDVDGDSPNLQNLVEGLDGNIWFSDLGDNQIGRITTKGVITQYTVPTANSAVDGIAAGSTGGCEGKSYVWSTENSTDQIAQVYTGN